MCLYVPEVFLRLCCGLLRLWKLPDMGLLLVQIDASGNNQHQNDETLQASSLFSSFLCAHGQSSLNLMRNIPSL